MFLLALSLLDFHFYLTSLQTIGFHPLATDNLALEPSAKWHDNSIDNVKYDIYPMRKSRSAIDMNKNIAIKLS